MVYARLSANEVNKIDFLLKRGANPSRILRVLQQSRRRAGSAGPGKTAVYNFFAGATHVRGALETRGRKSSQSGGCCQSPVAMRHLSDNYQTTIRQLSDNYQTNGKNRHFHVFY